MNATFIKKINDWQGDAALYKKEKYKFWYKYENDWFEMDMSQSSVHSWEVLAKAEDMTNRGYIVTFDDPFQD